MLFTSLLLNKNVKPYEKPYATITKLSYNLIKLLLH